MKKPFGCGITIGLGRKFLIRVLADEENITIATYETFQYQHDKEYDVWRSLCTPFVIWTQNAKFASELPELTHNPGPLPVHFTGGDLILGELFGRKPSLAFQLRSKVTLNKSFDIHGINRKTLWAVHSDVLVLMANNGNLLVPHNKFAFTKTSKQDGMSYILGKSVSGVAQVYLAHPTGSFANDGLRITVNEDLGYVSDLDFDQPVGLTAEDFHNFAAMFYPKITVPESCECPTGGVVEIPIYINNPDGMPYMDPVEVYIKSQAGYLPFTKITIDKAAGTARFMALGLVPGERATVKFGYKYYENDASINVMVV